MLTDTTLRSAVEALWDKLWTGGLVNPLDAIEQLSLLGEFATGQAVGVALFVVGYIARVGVSFEKVMPSVDEKSTSSCGRIANTIAWARIAHVDHHADDVPRRAELPVLASGIQLAEQILVEVAVWFLQCPRRHPQKDY